MVKKYSKFLMTSQIILNTIFVIAGLITITRPNIMWGFNRKVYSIKATQAPTWALVMIRLSALFLIIVGTYSLYKAFAG